MNGHRPIMRYHGGKWRLAPWIIQFFPKHRIYVEPYGGAASVLFQNERAFAEIYNDLDKEILNVFQVIRSHKKALRLQRLLALTPYHYNEFRESYKQCKDPVEQARRTIVRSFMGYSSDSATRGVFTGFRSTNFTSGRFSSQDWPNISSCLTFWIDRMRSVCCENRPALKVIGTYDTPDTLFYCDPPYVWSSRHAGNKSAAYKHEMSDDDHRQLAELLHRVKGMVVLSGYESPLYRELYRDWHMESKKCVGQTKRGGRTNIECLWISQKTYKLIGTQSLFSEERP